VWWAFGELQFQATLPAIEVDEENEHIMRSIRAQIVMGLVLVAAGLLFLLQNLGLISGAALMWGAALAAGGLVFLYVYLQDRQQWWGLIPGFTLLGIGSMMILGELVPGVSEVWGGALVLGGIGVAFAAVYLSGRERWWAIIPAGVMLTLAAVTLIDPLVGNESIGGGLFFIGLGLTFGALYLLPTSEGRMTWAAYPAAILLIFGLLLSAALSSLAGYFWPLLIIILGGWLVVRSFRRQHHERDRLPEEETRHGN
jgi:hypothetical protein